MEKAGEVKWETMWEGPDSQDVGLEAAIIVGQ